MIPTLHWQDMVAAVVDDLISLSVVAVVVAADAMVAVVAQAYLVLKCQYVVEYWGCMVTAADLALIVMMDLVAAFDCGNLGSLFG